MACTLQLSLFFQKHNPLTVLILFYRGMARSIALLLFAAVVTTKMMLSSDAYLHAGKISLLEIRMGLEARALRMRWLDLRAVDTVLVESAWLTDRALLDSSHDVCCKVSVWVLDWCCRRYLCPLRLFFSVVQWPVSHSFPLLCAQASLKSLISTRLSCFTFRPQRARTTTRFSARW